MYGKKERIINYNYIYLFVALMAFSTMGIVTKTIISQVGSTVVTFIRFLIGGIVLLPFALSDLKKRQVKLGIRDIFELIGLGFLNVAVSMNLGNIGLQYNNANISGILFATNPLFVAVFAHFISKERMNAKKWFGLFIGLIGMIITLSDGFSGTKIDGRFMFGAACSIAGAVIYGFYTVAGKGVTAKMGSLTYTSLTAIFGSITSVPFMIWQGGNPFTLDFKAYWWQIIYVSVFVTGIGFYSYFKSMETLNATLASMVFFIKPIVVTVLSAIILKEAVTINLVIGIVVVLSGLALVKYSDKFGKKSA